MCDQAIERFQKTSERSEMHQTVMASLAHAYARYGRTNDAEVILDELITDPAKRYVTPYLFGAIHAGLSESDPAVAWLQRAFETHDVWMIWVNRDPRFDSLRTEPRFQNFLRRMNFSA